MGDDAKRRGCGAEAISDAVRAGWPAASRALNRDECDAIRKVLRRSREDNRAQANDARAADDRSVAAARAERRAGRAKRSDMCNADHYGAVEARAGQWRRA